MKPVPVLILAVSAALALYAAGRSHATTPATPSAIAPATVEAPVEPGRLQAASVRAGGDDIAGAMTSASGAMSFRTTSLGAAGALAARGAAPDRVQARLEINGAVIDHEIDYAAGTLTVRTDGSVVIDTADRDVLKTFHTELGRNLTAQAGGMQRMPKAHDMLWRLAEMYSEVPLGKTLPPVWVIRRDGTAAQAERGTPAAPEGWQPGLEGNPTSLVGAAAACNEKAGGSFVNLHAIVDVCLNSRTYYRSSSHDFCPSHGYTAKSVAYGCGASACAGRCGAGCGVADGMGAWYQDCLDHDVCNRDHNSQLGACGDEWNEAADDYAFGAISCYTTCH